MFTQFGHDLADVASAPLAQFLLDAAAKATVLLVAAMVAAAVLRRSSAALRHRIWCLMFAALVLLPGLSAALPEWPLAVLPYHSRLAPREETSVAPQRSDADIATTERSNAVLPRELPLAEREDYGKLPRHDDAEQLTTPVMAAGADDGAVRPSLDLATVWFAGTFVAIMPVVVSVVRTLRLRRQSHPLIEADWLNLLNELRARLGLARRVELLEADAAVMPMTWGLLRPAVLLPRQARDWTDRLRRIVLLHELAHVKRGDVAFQMLGRLACALYWFHPLAWYALRRLRIERELACDDCVVYTGERASDYAAELLQIARSYRPIRFATAVAMAQRNNLEHRLRALFDRACSHLPLSARAARLLLAGVLALVTTIAVVRVIPRATPDDDAREAAAKSKLPSPPATRSKPWRVTVRVVDSDDVAIAGARVRVLRVDWQETSWSESGHVVAEARTDDNGVLSLDYDDAGPFATREQFIVRGMVVLIDADGYAFDWFRPESADYTTTVRLSPDDTAIEGRVLDLEGRPRSDVRVGIVAVERGAGDLDAWVKAATKNPVALDHGSRGQPIRSREMNKPPEVARFPGDDNVHFGDRSLLGVAQSDKTGRFRLSGLGRDRFVMLELSGAGIAKTWLNVVTRDMPSVPYPDHDPRFRVQTCFGRRFNLTAEPEQLITGVVCDADNGLPLAGVEVWLGQYADGLLDVEGFLSATSDDRGRYVLHGVPKPHDPERSHLLRIVPGVDHPYFRSEIDVAKRDGLDPVTCDVKLKRALRLRGRVTDAVTGQPIRGLVEYYPFQSNQSAADYDNFDPGVRALEGDRYATDDDGAYRLPVLPGRGVVAFIAHQRARYPEADGAKAIVGLEQKGAKELNIYHLWSADCVSALREVNPPPEAPEAVCDIKLSPLETAQVELIDPDGRAVVGAVTRRLAPLRMGPNDIGWSYEALPTAMAEIIGPSDQSRTVMFLHRERKLAAALSLPSSEKLPKQLVLGPCASIRGRIVDRQGKPVARLNFELNAAPNQPAKNAEGGSHSSGEMEHQLERMPTDDDGKFKIELVPPGVSYVVWAKLGDDKLEKTTPVIRPGESLDIGDLALLPAAGGANKKRAATDTDRTPPVASSTASAVKTTDDAESSPKDKTEVTTLRGRVLDPGGKPLTGAKVYLSYPSQGARKPRLLGAAGDDGRFQFDVEKAELDSSQAFDSRAGANIAAIADGFGLEWLDLDKRDANGEYTLRLVNDVPIRGRIIDVDGQGLAAAKLRLRQISVPANGLDGYIEATRGGSVFQFDRSRDTLPGAPEEITLDKDGRFTLRGVGAERVVELFVEGPNIEWWYIKVMTRDTDAVLVGHGVPGTAIFPRPDRVYGAEFGHVAPPSKSIVGTVRDSKTGDPIAGVKIQSRDIFGSSTHVPQTDTEGRFELLGHPKVRQYDLLAVPEGLPYFERGTKIQDTPGLAPLSVELTLLRGIEAQGRMTFEPDHQPGPGTVEYHPLRPNPYAVDLWPRSFGRPLATATIGADGVYRLPVLPGPGVLGFRARGFRRLLYAPAYVGPDETAQFFHDGQDHGDERTLQLETGKPGRVPLFQTSYNRLVLINPAEGAAQVQADVTVEQGRTVNGVVYGADGQPLAGAMVLGLGGERGIGEVRLDTPEFTVTAMHPRHARELVFRHPGKGWGKLLNVPGDQIDPLAVRLEPCGTLVGRLVDAEAMPLAGASISVARHAHGPPLATIETDGGGKFRVENLLPGLKYILSLLKPAQPLGRSSIQNEIVVSPGETKDLGDVTVSLSP